MIRTQELYKSYGKAPVLHNLSLQFDAGQVVAVIGPNGSGKTTLIKCLLGMVIPERGAVYVQGEDVAGRYDYRRQIGYMPQIGRYPEHLQIGQVFDLILDLRGMAGQAGPDESLIEAFRLRDIWQKRMGALSGGTKQKVSAALAFLFDPPVLILDEPTAGLDPHAAELLKQHILKARDAGKLVLITSHILSDLEELATDVMYIFEGRLQFFKSLEALREESGEQKLGRIIAQYMQQLNDRATPTISPAP